MAKALVLIAPGLLSRPDETLAAMPALRRLAAYADAGVAAAPDVVHALFAALAMRVDTPTGPLALLGKGGDPGDDYVLCAAPVELARGAGDSVEVRGVSEIPAADADRLVRMLDRHFANDDLRFEALHGTPWFARRTQASVVTMTSPAAAHGRALAASLPQGEDAARWRRWQDEIAMMLHDDPINRAREAADLPPVSGVWFFGGGRLCDVDAPPRVLLAGVEGWVGDVARGLVRRRDPDDVTPETGLAATLARAADVPGEATTHVVATTPPGAEEDLLERALAHLEARDVDVLHLVAAGRRGAMAWRARAPTRMRRLFARARPRALPLQPAS